MRSRVDPNNSRFDPSFAAEQERQVSCRYDSSRGVGSARSPHLVLVEVLERLDHAAPLAQGPHQLGVVVVSFDGGGIRGAQRGG